MLRLGWIISKCSKSPASGFGFFPSFSLFTYTFSIACEVMILDTAFSWTSSSRSKASNFWLIQLNFHLGVFSSSAGHLPSTSPRPWSGRVVLAGGLPSLPPPQIHRHPRARGSSGDWMPGWLCGFETCGAAVMEAEKLLVRRGGRRLTLILDEVSEALGIPRIMKASFVCHIPWLQG